MVGRLTKMNGKIDVVVTWVDGNDPKWLEEKKNYDNAATSNGKEDSNSANRYRDWELMRYWFRGIEKNMPFINKIFFVTWGHVPQWLDTDNERLVVVKHKDYIPEKYLPTYNSNVIELNLHRIEELSENFVLFNDDIFLIDKTKEEMFFKNDKPCDMLISTTYYNYDVSTIFYHTVFNNLGVINKHFGMRWLGWKLVLKWISPKFGRKNMLTNFDTLVFKRVYGFIDQHFTISHKKSVFKEIWEKEYENLDRACMNKFRTPMDFSQWLMRYWNFMTGNFEPVKLYDIGDYYGLSDEESLETICNKIKERNRPLLVINDLIDGVSDEQFLHFKNKLIQEFDKLFPEKSSYEKY